MVLLSNAVYLGVHNQGEIRVREVPYKIIRISLDVTIYCLSQSEPQGLVFQYPKTIIEM